MVDGVGGFDEARGFRTTVRGDVIYTWGRGDGTFTGVGVTMLGRTDREGTGGGGNEECEGPIMGGCEEEGWEIGEGEDGVQEGGEEDIGASTRGEAEEMGVTKGGIAILGVPEDDNYVDKEDDDSEGKGDVYG